MMPSTEQETRPVVDALKVRAALHELGYESDPEAQEDLAQAALQLNHKGVVGSGRKHWTWRGLKSVLQGEAAAPSDKKQTQSGKQPEKKSKPNQVKAKVAKPKVSSSERPVKFEFGIKFDDSKPDNEALSYTYKGSTVDIAYSGKASKELLTIITCTCNEFLVSLQKFVG